MADPTYLEAHPPARSQYRRPRRAEPSGAIVVHTAENAPDLDGDDGGAEGVARFISTRTDAGSYHTVVDADSIVRVVPYDAEAYGEGTGGNPYALHLSFAVKTGTWDELEPDRLAAIVLNGARAAADMARWLNPKGKATPAVRISADAYRRKAAGFISHAELDPSRRSDPGASFPWGAFLDLYAQELHMPTTTDPVKASQQRLNDSGAKPPLVIDGVWGPACDAALDAVLHYQQGQMADLKAANATSADTIARLGAERDFHMTTAKRLEGERDTAIANREAAEAEAAQLRAQLQTGGRMPQLLADLDAAIAKARA